MREMRIQPITNLLPNPLPSSALGWAMSNAGTGGVGIGGYDATLQAFYAEVTTAATNNTYTVRYSNSNANRVPTQGDAYYWEQCEVMSTVDDARAFAFDFYNAGGAQLAGIATGERIALPANKWVPFFIAGKSGDMNAVGSSVCVIYTGTTGPAPVIRPVGSRLYIRRGMAGMGVQTGPIPYADGNTPGWRWTGTANGSVSVGWPYTLESIAGAPLAQISTPGASSGPLGLAATDDRTVYLVHDVIDTNSDLQVLSAIGPSASVGAGVLAIRTGSAASNRIENRSQTVGGTAAFATVIGPRTPGRHVTVSGMSSAATSIFAAVDGGTPVTSTLVPGSGMSVGASNLLNLGPVGTSDVPITTIAFRGAHSAETQRRVTAWLARKYGAPIPAGY